MHNRRQVLGGGVLGAAMLGTAAHGRAHLQPDGGTLARFDADLKTYAAFGNKMSGGPGDLASAAWMAKRLEETGFATERQDFSVPRFEVAQARVAGAGKPITVFPQPIVVPTPTSGITGRAVLVRNVYEATQARGEIAFLVLPYGRHAAIFTGMKALLDPVIAAKPRAIVIVTTGPTDEITCLNTRLKPIAPVPIALMAPRDLPAIEQAAAGRQRVTLTVTGTESTGQSCNILARRIAGPQWLVFSTPRSGWGPCAGERGPGIAAMLELCRWAVTRFPNHSIFASSAGGHELDFVGAHHVLEKAPPADHTLVWTHLGAGLATRDALEIVRQDLPLMSTADPQRVLMASPSLMADARTAFRGLAGYDQPIEVVGGVGELSSIIARGYSHAFAGLGVHRWCHVESDTIDKVDAELLLPVFQAHRDLVEMTVGRMAARRS